MHRRRTRRTQRPAAASVLPFDPQQASPFAAAFQTALKGAATNGKSPVASKPQDSSRGPANATAAGNNPLGLFLPGMVSPALAPIPVEPSLPAAALQSLVGVSALDGNTNQGTNASGNLFSLNSAMDVPAGAGQANASAPNSTDTSKAALLDPLGSLGDDKTAVEAGTAPQDSKSALQIAANQIDLGAIPNPSSNVSQDALTPQSGATNSTSVPDPTNALLPVATNQDIPSGAIADSKPIPQDPASPPVQEGSANKLLENLLQSNIASASPQPVPQNIAADGATPPAGKTAQTAHADMKFLNLQTLIPASAAAKASLSASAQPPANHDPQPNLPPAITSPTLTETLEHSAAKSAALGAPTLKFHDNAKSQSDDSAPSVPMPAVSAKAQPQDGSNGSHGNDSNSKQDRSSPVASVRTDDKGFVQTLNATAANPATGHAPAPDPTAVAASIPSSVSAEPQATHSGTQQPAASSGADLHPSESLPAAPQGSAVVNTAHITVQPGQTEIRIEMQAESLGGVELRAHIAGDQIGASISVEHHDAQVALTTDLPALHIALAEKNLHLQSFTVSQGSFSSLSGGTGHDSGQRGFPQGHAIRKICVFGTTGDAAILLGSSERNGRAQQDQAQG